MTRRLECARVTYASRISAGGARSGDVPGGTVQSAVVPVDEEFAVPAPPADVWELLRDARTVASCVPGASLAAERGEGVYEGAISVKLGPTEVEFRGEVVQEIDPSERRGTLTAQGADARGRSRARAVLVYRVDAVPTSGESARVALEGSVEVFGVLSSFARTGGPHLAKRMTADFAEEFGRRVRGANEGVVAEQPERRAPMSAVRLFWLTVRDWFAERMRRLRRSRAQNT